MSLVKADIQYSGYDPSSIFGNESPQADSSRYDELDKEDMYEADSIIAEYAPEDDSMVIVGNQHFENEEADEKDSRNEKELFDDDDLSKSNYHVEDEIPEAKAGNGHLPSVRNGAEFTQSDESYQETKEGAGLAIQRVYRGRLGRKRAAAMEMRREREQLKSRQRKQREEEEARRQQQHREAELLREQLREEEEEEQREREEAERKRKLVMEEDKRRQQIEADRLREQLRREAEEEAEEEKIRLAAAEVAEKLTQQLEMEEEERQLLSARADTDERRLQDEAEENDDCGRDLVIKIEDTEEDAETALVPFSPVLKVQPSPPPKKPAPPPPKPPPPARRPAPSPVVLKEKNNGVTVSDERDTQTTTHHYTTGKEHNPNEDDDDVAVHKPRKLPPIQPKAVIVPVDIDEESGGLDGDLMFGEARPGTGSSSVALSETAEEDPEGISSPTTDRSERNVEDKYEQQAPKAKKAYSGSELDSEIAHIERMLSEAVRVFGSGDDNGDDEGEGESDYNGDYDEDGGDESHEMSDVHNEDDDISFSEDGGSEGDEDETACYEDSLDCRQEHIVKSPVKYAPTIRDLNELAKHTPSPVPVQVTRVGLDEQARQQLRQSYLSGRSLSDDGMSQQSIPLELKNIRKVHSVDSQAPQVIGDGKISGRRDSDSEGEYSARSGGVQKGADRFNALAIARKNNAALMLQRVFRGHLARQQAAIRREKLRMRFACPNCGMLEQGGMYCKRCGRRCVGADRPKDSRKGREQVSSRRKSLNSVVKTHEEGQKKPRAESEEPRGQRKGVNLRESEETAAGNIAPESQKSKRVEKSRPPGGALHPIQTSKDEMDDGVRNGRVENGVGKGNRRKERPPRPEQQQNGVGKDGKKEKRGRREQQGVDEDAEIARLEAEVLGSPVGGKLIQQGGDASKRTGMAIQPPAAAAVARGRNQALTDFRQEPAPPREGRGRRKAGRPDRQAKVPSPPAPTPVRQDRPLSPVSNKVSPSPAKPLHVASSPVCDIPLPFQAVLGPAHQGARVGAGEEPVGYLSEFVKRAGKKQKKSAVGGPPSSTKQQMRQAQAPPPMPFELRSVDAAADPTRNKVQGAPRVGDGSYGEEYEESRSLPAIPMKKETKGEKVDTGGDERRRDRRRSNKGNERRDEGVADRTHGTMSAPSRLKKENEDERLRLPPPVRKSHDYEEVQVGRVKQTRGGGIKSRKA